MSTAIVPAALAALALVAAPIVGPASSPAPCVRVESTCYPTIQSALEAAPDGATVVVPAGRFAGGVAITTSITLRGAGAGKTIIAGGEHVVSVGTLFAPAGTQPTVTIAGVTITGGFATDMPGAERPGTEARGGGVLMLPDEEWGGGDLTISDSVVSDNRAAPSANLYPEPEWEEFWPRCSEDAFCAYGGAYGAGIDARGSLTLIRTLVSGNESSGALVSDAVGGGIAFDGTLRLIDSTVKANRALGTGVHARYAEGGGIFGHSGTLSLLRSSVSGNESTLTVSWPIALADGTAIDTLANGGGIHLGDDGNVSIVSSHVDGNRTTYDNPNGNWGAINAGAQFGAGTTLDMRDSTVNGNVLTARVRNTEASGPIGSVIEWNGDASIVRSAFVGNAVTVAARDGDVAAAAAVAALSILAEAPGRTTISASTISGNVVTAKTTSGRADVVGAGMISETDLTLKKVVITGNKAVAAGSGGTSVGGGLATGALLPGTPTAPLSALTLIDTAVTGNVLVAGKGITRSGGGVYSEVPVSATRSVVAGNSPDQCVGCGVPPKTQFFSFWKKLGIAERRGAAGEPVRP